MSDGKDPHDDDHIEELLSQLQGIFGKLSRSDEEESQTKVDPPAQVPPPPQPPPTPQPPPPPVEPSEPMTATIPTSPASSFPTVSDAPLKSVSIPEPEPAPVPPSISEIPPIAPDDATVYSLIFYPPNRENEAKSLTEKVETMTPRFTKVAFQIKVVASIPTDPKVDPYENVLPHIKDGIRAVFFIVDRPMDDLRRKAITGNLEPKGIYVHEVPAISVEKKAFYTDLLLGMVFFYDSLKSNAD